MPLAEFTPFFVGDWLVEPDANRISRGEDALKIDPQHMSLLVLLSSRPNVVFSQSEIEAAVWQGVVVTPNSLYQGIAQLRRALRDARANPRYIETVARKGYRLIAPVRPATESSCHGDAPAVAAPTLGPPIGNSKPRWTPMRWLASSVLVAAALGLLVMIPWSSDSEIDVVTDQLEQLVLASAQSRGEISAGRVQLLTALSMRLLQQGRSREPQAYLEEAVDIQRRLSGKESQEVVGVLAELANAYLWSSELSKAEATAREAVRVAQVATPPLYPKRIAAHQVLALSLIETGQLEEGAMHLQQALDLSGQLNGESSVDKATLIGIFGELRLVQHRLDEAEELLREAQAMYVELRGKDVESVAYYSRLAHALMDQGRYDESIAESRVALGILKDTPNHPYFLSAQQILAEALIAAGRPREAEPILRTQIERLKDTNSEPWRIARAKSTLGEALLAQGRVADAETYLVVALPDLRGGGNWNQRLAYQQAQHRLAVLRRVRAEAGVSAGQVSVVSRE